MYERVRGLTDAQLLGIAQSHFDGAAHLLGVRAGYMSTTATLMTGAGRCVLKVVPEDGDAYARVRFGLRFNRALLEGGVPVARNLPARDGRTVVRERGCACTLWEWVEGDAFVPGDRAALAAVGATLGRIHRAGADLSADGDAARCCAGDVEAEALAVLNRIDGADPVAQAIGERLRAELRDVVFLVGADDPVTVIHGDYRAQNLLFASHRVVGVLDLDGGCAAPRMLDLAYALAFFQAVVAPGPLSEPEMRCFLRAYLEQNALTAGECARLPLWLRLALVKGLALWLRIAFVEGVNPGVRHWFAPYLELLDRVQAVGERLWGLEAS